jgi:hypothetical protein
MKKIIFLFLITSTAFSQEKISGTITNDFTKLLMPNVNIININKVKGTVTNGSGFFEIQAAISDTLHIS